MAVVVLLMAGLFRIGSRSWLPERTAKLSSYLFLSALILVAMYLLSLGVAERPWMMFLIISVVLSLVIGFTFIYFSTDRIGRVIGLRDNTRWIMIILVIFAIIVVAIWLISRPLSGLDGNNLRTMKLMARIDTRVVQSRHGYWYLRGGGGESDYQLLEVIHPSVVNVISAYNKSTDRIGVLEKEFFDRIKNLTTTINDRNKFDRTYRARKGLDDVALKEAKRILNGFDERIRIRIGVINEYNQYAIKDEAKLMEMFVRLKRINDLLLVEMSAAKTYPEKERPRSPVNVPTDIIDVDQYDIELTKRLNEIRKMVEQD
jgi:hypothetical protein